MNFVLYDFISKIIVIKVCWLNCVIEVECYVWIGKVFGFYNYIKL